MITLKAKVELRNGGVLAEKSFTVGVMELSKVRRWLTREFNIALKAAGRDVIIDASYYGQMQAPPYTAYSGGLTGLNGAIMRREGSYEF